jgi:CRISPR/Cas system-associated exonuclease Cas4 (RecB family)
MPTPIKKRIEAWSWSRYNDYRKCPALAGYKYVTKPELPPGEGSPAMDRGTGIHQIAQAFASKEVPAIDKRDGDRLKPFKARIAAAAKGTMPKELASFRKEFNELRKIVPLVEQEWAFNNRWQPVGWFGAEAWCRVKVDAHHHNTKDSILPIIDHKTGKVYEEDGRLQMELYGVAGLIKYPDVKVVHSQLWYLDQGEKAEHEFKREDLPKLQNLWTERTKAMLSDTKFATRPGYYCRWCEYSADNLGPCKM